MDNLRKIRKAKGMTMKQLGKLVGVSESAIGQYETNARKPSFEILLKLGEALDCSVDDLVSDEKTPATEIGDGRGPTLDLSGASEDQLSLIKDILRLPPRQAAALRTFVESSLSAPSAQDAQE